MDLNKLKTFLMVAETLDLQSTAKKIFRTQPAVTQQIKGLERELGMPLFEKKGRGLILTNQGMRLCAVLKLPFQQLEESLQVVLERETEPKGDINIGVLSDHAVSNGIFTSIAQFCSLYPKINIRTKFGTSKDIEPLLFDNQLDFGVLIYLAKPDHFEKIPLAPATHHPVSSSRYVKDVGAIRSAQDLIELDLLDQDPAWWSWTQWFECHFPKSIAQLNHLKPRLTIPSYTALKEVVMSGFGVAMLPEYLIQKELSSKRLVRLWPRMQSLVFDLCLVCRKTKIMNSAEEHFLQFLKDNFQVS